MIQQFIHKFIMYENVPVFFIPKVKVFVLNQLERNTVIKWLLTVYLKFQIPLSTIMEALIHKIRQCCKNCPSANNDTYSLNLQLSGRQFHPYSFLRPQYELSHRHQLTFFLAGFHVEIPEYS